MKKTKVKIRELIIEFENGKESIQETVSKINQVSYLKIDENFLRNYWKSSKLEDFIELLSTPEIEKWSEIDDDYAQNLIREILNNLNNEVLINRNTSALEKRFKKSTGTITNWIFYDDITDGEKIMKLLKRSTTIQL